MKYLLALLLLLIVNEPSFSQTATVPYTTLPTVYVDKAIQELKQYDEVVKQLDAYEEYIADLEERIKIADYATQNLEAHLALVKQERDLLLSEKEDIVKQYLKQEKRKRFWRSTAGVLGIVLTAKLLIPSL